MVIGPIRFGADDVSTNVIGPCDLASWNLSIKVQCKSLASVVNGPIRFGAYDVSTNLIGACDLDS